MSIQSLNESVSRLNVSHTTFITV